MVPTKDKPFPAPGWWNQKDLTFGEFLQALQEFNQISYARNDVVFTHDLYVGEVLLGEAAQMEDAGPGLRIGYYSLIGLEPAYGILHPRLELMLKAHIRQ